MTSSEHDEFEAWGSDPEYLLVVNPDTDVHIDQAMSIQDWMIGFGHMPHPLEYRPRGQLV